MDLRFTMYHMTKKSKPPADVMRELGIEFVYCIPQTMGDQIWYHNCTNVPDKLPEYITRMKIDDKWL